MLKVKAFFSLAVIGLVVFCGDVFAHALGANVTTVLASGYEWKPAPAMAIAREGQTATTLADGRVLVAGGRDASGLFLSSAELFDPVANSWIETGSMAQSRGDGFTATLLKDGRVLVVGGFCDCYLSDQTASAEIYDPSSGRWSTTAPMHVPRTEHIATLLNDGRVLVTGGVGDGTIWDTAEIFDPATSSWSTTQVMNAPRVRHNASILRDGRVLVTGGECDVECDVLALNTAELFDPLTNGWTAVAPMSFPRFYHAQASLPDGRVLVAGGWTPTTGATNSVELFDPARDRWLPGPPTLVATEQVAAGTLPGGRVMLAGGFQGFEAPTTSTEIYHPALNVWIFAGSESIVRSRPAGAVLRDGRFLLTGGYTNCFPDCTTATTEINRPVAEAFVQLNASLSGGSSSVGARAGVGG